MKPIIWILYVVITNANGDPASVVEMEPVFESKAACKQKAVGMRLYIENYGCRPVLSADDAE